MWLVNWGRDHASKTTIWSSQIQNYLTNIQTVLTSKRSYNINQFRIHLQFPIRPVDFPRFKQHPMLVNPALPTIRTNHDYSGILLAIKIRLWLRESTISWKAMGFQHLNSGNLRVVLAVQGHDGLEVEEPVGGSRTHNPRTTSRSENLMLSKRKSVTTFPRSNRSSQPNDNFSGCNRVRLPWQLQDHQSKKNCCQLNINLTSI